MERVGWEAARQLDALITGGPLAASTRLLSPLGVVTRQSSDILAVDDDDLQAALQFIKEFHSQTISVPDVARHVGLSRSMLGKKFRKHIGHSSFKEIRRVRIGAAKQLRLDTDIALAEIARRCGFSSSIRLANAFKETTGTTPNEFRRSREAHAV